MTLKIKLRDQNAYYAFFFCLKFRLDFVQGWSQRGGAREAKPFLPQELHGNLKREEVGRGKDKREIKEESEARGRRKEMDPTSNFQRATI